MRTMVDPNSKNDRKLQELMKVIKRAACLSLGWRTAFDLASSDQGSTGVLVMSEDVKVKPGGQIAAARCVKPNLFNAQEHFHYLVESLKALPDPFPFHVVNVPQTNHVKCSAEFEERSDFLKWESFL